MCQRGRLSHLDRLEAEAIRAVREMAREMMERGELLEMFILFAG